MTKSCSLPIIGKFNDIIAFEDYCNQLFEKGYIISQTEKNYICRKLRNSGGNIIVKIFTSINTECIPDKSFIVKFCWSDK